MRILITAGPTREYFDDVRFISNASSGKLGYAIAAEAVRRGHHVVLVSGPVELSVPEGVEFVPVVSAQAMLDACREHFESCDAAVMSAAVCDYRPATHTAGKTPKITETHSVTLEPTEDICAALGKMKETANRDREGAKPKRILIGFALETHDARARAEAKLRRKHCDAIVLNHPAGIGADATTVEVFISGEGWSPPRSASKADLAAYLNDLLDRLARGSSEPSQTTS